MQASAIPLGIPEMDEDHARIEALLAEARQTPDSGLPSLLSRVSTEVAGHFACEEEFLRARDYPGMFCHAAQHKVLLADLTYAGRTSGEALRRQLETVIPQLILSHIATMDRMAAQFISGELTQADFDALRLPVPEARS